jgi:hypothetical protein
MFSRYAGSRLKKLGSYKAESGSADFINRGTPIKL